MTVTRVTAAQVRAARFMLARGKDDERTRKIAAVRLPGDARMTP